MPQRPIPILTLELDHAYFREGSTPWTDVEWIPFIDGTIVRDLRPWNLILHEQTLYYWGSGEETVPADAWSELPELYLGIFPKDLYFPTYTDLPLGLGSETLWLIQPSPSNLAFHYSLDSIDQVHLKPDALVKDLYKQVQQILSPQREEQKGSQDHYIKVIPEDPNLPEWKLPVTHERDVQKITSPPLREEVSTRGGFSVALALAGEEQSYSYTDFDAPITKAFMLGQIPSQQYPLGVIHLKDWAMWAKEKNPKVKVSFDAAKVRVHYHVDLSKSEKTFHSLSFHSTAKAAYRFRKISPDEPNEPQEDRDGAFDIKDAQQLQVFAVVHDAIESEGGNVETGPEFDPSPEALLTLSSHPAHPFELILSAHTGQEYQLTLPYPDYRSIRRDEASPHQRISEIFVFI
ncbi:MAG: hypothetical protein AAFQ92_14115 [Bacteroidota bacterium]